MDGARSEGTSGGDDVAEFQAALRQLRADAGGPSYRVMAKRSGAVSHSALHEATSGARLPTWLVVREYVRSCDGDEQQWKRRWARASARIRRDDDPAVSPSLAVQPAMGIVRRRSLLCRPVLTHLAAALIGVIAGGGALVAFTGTDAPAPAPSAELACENSLSDDGAQMHTAAYTPAVFAGPKPQSPAWVARPGYDAQILTGTDVTIPITSPVAAGDALIASMMLTSTCPDPVTITDTQHNRYRVIADVFDTRHHRTMIIAAFGVTPLTTADTIHIAYVHASKYHVAIDEYRGVHVATGHVTAHGESGGTAFSTASHPLTCVPGELMLSAVGSNTGSAPQYAKPWAALPTLKLSSYRLTTGYQIAHVGGPCAVTGTTTSQWAAAMATLR